MDGLIKFGHEILGLDEFEAFIFLCLIFVVGIIYKRYSNYQKTKLDTLSLIVNEFSKKDQNNRDFIIEQVLERKFGKVIDYPIIDFFMKTKTPSKNLNEYVLGCDFIEFSDNHRKIYFKRKYASNKIYLHIAFLLITYISFSLLLLLLFTNEFILAINSLPKVLTYGLLIGTCILVIYTVLTASSKPHAAISLVKKFGDKNDKK